MRLQELQQLWLYIHTNGIPYAYGLPGHAQETSLLTKQPEATISMHQTIPDWVCSEALTLLQRKQRSAQRRLAICSLLDYMPVQLYKLCRF